VSPRVLFRDAVLSSCDPLRSQSGLSVSFVDLGANTVGSAYEQAYDVTAMTGLHAWFSAGALAGAFGSAVALSAGIGYRAVYLGLAAVMAAGLLTALLAAIPAPPATAPGRRPPRRSGRVWRIPAVLFAIALISVTFFGDGALESFLSSYLQRTLAGGVLLSGIGIGSYHFASLLGRLTATAVLRRYGERRVVTGAGLLAATGLLIAVMAPDAAGAIGGLLLVGFAIAPVAGQPAPGYEAREPGAGSRKTRRRAMSSTGAGSPLRMASRRESLPHR